MFKKEKKVFKILGVFVILSVVSIGKVQLNNPFILAPMAGVCDLPFRLLCSEIGAGMVCMEMISAKAIMYNNKNTETKQINEQIIFININSSIKKDGYLRAKLPRYHLNCFFIIDKEITPFSIQKQVQNTSVINFHQPLTLFKTK